MFLHTEKTFLQGKCEQQKQNAARKFPTTPPPITFLMVRPLVLVTQSVRGGMRDEPMEATQSHVAIIYLLFSNTTFLSYLSIIGWFSAHNTNKNL